MEEVKEKPWSYAIKRNIFELLTILIFFSLIATSYRVWFHSQENKQSSIVNEYHLASHSSYLKAAAALRKLQNALLLDFQKTYSKPNDEKNKLYLVHESTQNYYLAKELVQGTLAKDSQYAIKAYRSISQKLASNFDKFDAAFNQFQANNSQTQQLHITLTNIIFTLEQISKLHHLDYLSKSKNSEQFSARNNIAFYALASLLVVLSLLSTYRSMSAIAQITKKQNESEAIIRKQANYDYLTNLPNRQLSFNSCEQSLERAERNQTKVAILFIDLDDFKKVNDTLGHDAGDEVLIEAASRLKHLIRGSDTVGRFGGDEFFIVIEQIVDEVDSAYIAEQLLTELKKTFKVNNRELLLSASIGISIYPKDGTTTADLLRKADSAMYHAKDSGHSSYSFFTNSMNKVTTRRLAIEEQLYEAVQRNELVVYFQPVINLNTNDIIGAEALLRWTNKTLGAIPPDEFIPVAEHTGLIIPIGEFVVEQALSCVSTWRRQQDLSIAINLSPRQFRDPTLVTTIENAALKFDIPATSIGLEITEGVLLSGSRYINEPLSELDKQGFKIVMDDFGTGYSSLSYLRNHPFDIVKIDRSFVQDMVENTSDASLVEAAVNMAHSLNMKVIAEGVENKQQLELLKTMGCEFAQGYLLGKPMSSEDFSQLISKNENLAS